RTLDAHQIFLEGFDRIVRQPVIKFVLRRLTGEYLEPLDPAGRTIGLLDRRVEHTLARRPNVRSRAVAADEGNDRLVRNFEFAVLNRDFSARRRGEVFVGHGVSGQVLGVNSPPWLRQPTAAVRGAAAADAAAPNSAFTLATTVSTVNPYLWRNSSTVLACSINWSGQPIGITGVVMRCS